MIPWITVHVLPSGDVLPCCMAKRNAVLGNLHENSLKEIWNSESYRRLRQNMVQNLPSGACAKCYELEEATQIHTLRKSVNRSFSHHLRQIEKTSPDGTVDGVNMAYMDIRFSNLCNFRCRTCGPEFSSAWFEDHAALFKEEGGQKSLNLFTDSKTRRQADLWKEIAPLLDSVEEVYFAGGEALLSEEHFRVLDHWIANGKKEVRLRYTTNFSRLEFGKKSIFEYWNFFSDVRVAASLDAMGDRAEYLRKGTRWIDIEENRTEMIRSCPQVYFEITPTVSLFNVFHLPDFHKTWVEKKLLEPQNVRMNLLLDPENQRIQLLPVQIKEEIRKRYENHTRWLMTLSDLDVETKTLIAETWQNVIGFLFQENRGGDISQFLRTTQALDRIRGESFFRSFPEYQALEVHP